MPIDRRSVLTAGAALAASSVLPAVAAAARQQFPQGFLWGAATAGHQVEGNNTASDTWFLENLKPSVFAEPSGDACNSFELWRQDLDLVRGLGLNSYRFSIEWARIEPEPGLFSTAMLDHYARMLDGCHERGLTPLVTFNHFTCPRWFSAEGGWLNKQAPERFARFCERAARHFGKRIGYATTLNEPNIARLLKFIHLPPQILNAQRATLAAATRASGGEQFVAANVIEEKDLDKQLQGLLAAHKAGRDAIKSVVPELPVGFSLALIDDQAVGSTTKRDEKRAYCYESWLEAARSDDFLGVQNYERARYNEAGELPAPKDAPVNWLGAEIYPPSLGNAVRYAHSVTRKPIIVTEHGLGTPDDKLRAAFIEPALSGLKAAMDEGIPVKGYMHWSLLDNFEWIFGYRPRFGLFEVDRKTFKRTAKPSSAVYSAIARRNAL